MLLSLELIVGLWVAVRFRLNLRKGWWKSSRRTHLSRSTAGPGSLRGRNEDVVEDGIVKLILIALHQTLARDVNPYHVCISIRHAAALLPGQPVSTLISVDCVIVVHMVHGIVRESYDYF